MGYVLQATSRALVPLLAHRTKCLALNWAVDGRPVMPSTVHGGCVPFCVYDVSNVDSRLRYLDFLCPTNRRNVFLNSGRATYMKLTMEGIVKTAVSDNSTPTVDT